MKSSRLWHRFARWARYSPAVSLLVAMLLILLFALAVSVFSFGLYGYGW